jgi:hypothetical protein
MGNRPARWLASPRTRGRCSPETGFLVDRGGAFFCVAIKQDAAWGQSQGRGLGSNGDFQKRSPKQTRRDATRKRPTDPDSNAKVARVTIADDHAIVREGLRALFEVTPDIAVAGEVERADELKLTVTKTRCDVLLLDLQVDRWTMDDVPGLPQLTKVVVLTGPRK